MNAITGVTINGGDNSTSTVARRPGQSGGDSGVNRGSASLAEDIVLDAEKSVMESFEFLNDGSGQMVEKFTEIFKKIIGKLFGIKFENLYLYIQELKTMMK